MEKEFPKHIGIIMDGNGRWAQKLNLNRSMGHLEGSKTFRKIALAADELGIKYLTVYAFSTDNFKRSKEEVGFLMDLFMKMFKQYKKEFNKKNIKVLFSGRREGLPNRVLTSLDELLNMTKNNTGNVINFCLNYGGQEEIVDATKKIVKHVQDNVLDINSLNRDNYYDYLYNDIPPADIIIRTGGDYRLSNFLAYQGNYAELFFTETLFPDFNKEELTRIIDCYMNRDRRFGGINNEKEGN